nr:MAG TPA: hypothetical protein [Caudoviricetes sp.]
MSEERCKTGIYIAKGQEYSNQRKNSEKHFIAKSIRSLFLIGKIHLHLHA